MATTYRKEIARSLRAFQERHEIDPTLAQRLLAHARDRYAAQVADLRRIQYEVRIKLSKKRKLVNHMLRRDGTKCFYCLHELGADISIEHLLERSQGGTNDHDNLRLAHKGCNRAVIGLSVMDKFQLRAERLALDVKAP